MFQSVYLDATFQPLLRRMDFLQEGHRLEFSPELSTSEVNSTMTETQTDVDTAVSVDGSTNVKAETNIGLSKAALGFKGAVEN